VVEMVLERRIRQQIKIDDMQCDFMKERLMRYLSYD